jgi:hypothetical protein
MCADDHRLCVMDTALGIYNTTLLGGQAKDGSHRRSCSFRKLFSLYLRRHPLEVFFQTTPRTWSLN